MSARNEIKQRDLQPCRLCGHGVMHAGDISFHRITIERFVVNVGAVQRAHGLELQIGALAQFMGPDEPMARTADELRTTAFVCQPCALALQLSVFELAERIATGDAVRVQSARDGGA
jgi:hypothetical protein